MKEGAKKMTKSEAVKVLKNIEGYTHVSLSEWLDVEIEALDMAIEELSKPNVIYCKDCIHSFYNDTGMHCMHMKLPPSRYGYCHRAVRREEYEAD